MELLNLKVETHVRGYHIYLVEIYQGATNLALDGRPKDACAVEHREVCGGCSGWIPAATEYLGVASCAGRVGSGADAGAEEDALPQQRRGVLQELGVYEQGVCTPSRGSPPTPPLPFGELPRAGGGVCRVCGTPGITPIIGLRFFPILAVAGGRGVKEP